MILDIGLGRCCVLHSGKCVHLAELVTCTYSASLCEEMGLASQLWLVAGKLPVNMVALSGPVPVFTKNSFSFPSIVFVILNIEANLLPPP